MKTIHNNISQKSLEEKNNNRTQIELIHSRLYVLSGKDKFLMTLYIENGYSIFQISRLTAIAQARIKRRIDRISKRLIEGKYIDCLRNRRKFNKMQMAIAKDHFLTGLSFRRIAKKRNWSIYKVRETIMRIKSILDECECVDTK